MHLKKLVLVTFILFSSISYSQSKKGDMAVSLTASPLTQMNSNNIGIIAKAGFEIFLSSKISLQGSFFASNNNVIKSEDTYSINAYGFIPSIQYFFINKQKINLFGQIGYGFGFDDETRNFGTIENSALRVYSIGAGCNYKLGEKLQLQLIIPYINAKNMTINQVSVEGITAFLGFNFIL